MHWYFDWCKIDLPEFLFYCLRYKCQHPSRTKWTDTQELARRSHSTLSVYQQANQMVFSLFIECLAIPRSEVTVNKVLFLCIVEWEGRGRILEPILSPSLKDQVYRRREYWYQAHTWHLSDKTNLLSLSMLIATVATRPVKDKNPLGLLRESLSSSITSISEIKDYINHELGRA